MCPYFWESICKISSNYISCIAISNNEYWATVGKLMMAGCTGWCPHFSSLWNRASTMFAHFHHPSPSSFPLISFTYLLLVVSRKRIYSFEYIFARIGKRAASDYDTINHVDIQLRSSAVTASDAVGDTVYYFD